MTDNSATRIVNGLTAAFRLGFMSYGLILHDIISPTCCQDDATEAPNL